MIILALAALVAKVGQFHATGRRDPFTLTAALVMLIWAVGFALLHAGFITIDEARAWFRIGTALFCTQAIVEGLSRINVTNAARTIGKWIRR